MEFISKLLNIALEFTRHITPFNDSHVVTLHITP